MTAKGIASVVFVDIILRESAMIAHVVQIFTKDQVIVFERDKNFSRMSLGKVQKEEKRVQDKRR